MKTTTKRRGVKQENPRSLANLLKGTWQPGQSGNPGGRPKKKPITDRYHRIVETELPDEIRGALGLPRGATFGDAIALALVRQAIKGDTTAAKEIREAIEGRSVTPAEFEGKNQGINIICDMPMPGMPTPPVIQQPDHGEPVLSLKSDKQTLSPSIARKT
ncbi:MAG: DUF5681 domain-containing protein [Candidatus Acidiferrales bacterium]